MIQYKPIFENIESQKNLELLADIIIKESVYRSIPILKRNVIEKEKDYKFYDEEFTIETFKFTISPIFYPVLVVNKGKINLEHNKLNKEIKAFLKSLGTLRIEFLERYHKSTTAGSYSNNNIIIYLPTKTYEKAEGDVIEAYSTENFPLERKTDSLIKLLSTEKDVIIHELQHYYDDYRSKGKYSSPNYSRDPNTDEYWRSSEEISARYTQAVSILKKEGTFRFTWKNVLSNFKVDFRKWDIISPDEQKRLISRLFQEYLEYNKQKDKPLLDITNQFKKFKNKYDTNEVDMWYHKDEKYIEIRRLNTGNIRKDEVILKEIIKFADTYRHMIMIYVEKGWVTSISQTINLLKKYDFNPNAGRKTNYKYKTGKRNFIRYTKRK